MLETYKEIFKRILNISDADLEEDYLFEEHENWDSFAHITLISELEDAFEIMLETDDILHFRSFENGKKILGKYGIII